MASNLWDSLTCANLFVAFAAVTGFAEKKLGRLSAEYVFVVEVFWSDGRTTYVKRTYTDFLKFYRVLGFTYKTKPSSSGEKLCLPRLEGRRWYKRYTRDLAEDRELELHHFVKELLKVSPDMASESMVIDFFEPRPTDPIPCPKEDKRFQPPLNQRLDSDDPAVLSITHSRLSNNNQLETGWEEYAFSNGGNELTLVSAEKYRTFTDVIENRSYGSSVEAADCRTPDESCPDLNIDLIRESEHCSPASIENVYSTESEGIFTTVLSCNSDDETSEINCNS